MVTICSSDFIIIWSDHIPIISSIKSNKIVLGDETISVFIKKIESFSQIIQIHFLVGDLIDVDTVWISVSEHKLVECDSIVSIGITVRCPLLPKFLSKLSCIVVISCLSSLFLRRRSLLGRRSICECSSEKSLSKAGRLDVGLVATFSGVLNEALQGLSLFRLSDEPESY